MIFTAEQSFRLVIEWVKLSHISRAAGATPGGAIGVAILGWRAAPERTLRAPISATVVQFGGEFDSPPPRPSQLHTLELINRPEYLPHLRLLKHPVTQQVVVPGTCLGKLTLSERQMAVGIKTGGDSQGIG